MLVQLFYVRAPTPGNDRGWLGSGRMTVRKLGEREREREPNGSGGVRFFKYWPAKGPGIFGLVLVCPTGLGIGVGFF